MEYEKTLPPIFDREGYAAEYIKTDAMTASYLGNQHIDNLMVVAYALATELWAERHRNRIVESLLSKDIKVTPSAIEQYMPSEAETAQWRAEQDAMVKRVFGVLTRDSAIGRQFSEPRFEDRPEDKK